MAMHTQTSKSVRKIATHKQEYLQRLITAYGVNWVKMAADTQLNYLQYSANKIQRDVKYWKRNFTFPKNRHPHRKHKL